VRFIIIVALAASLCACESQAEQDARFVAACVQKGFSPQQCSFLNAMANKSEDDAGQAAAIGVMGVSMSAIRR